MRAEQKIYNNCSHKHFYYLQQYFDIIYNGDIIHIYEYVLSSIVRMVTHK